MIPRTFVLATQNHFRLFLTCFVIGVAVLGLSGCGEPGPRALLKGEKLLHEGRFEKGLSYLQTAVRLLPNSAPAWNHLGLAYHGLNQPQQALNAYHRALTFDHRLAAARFNVGCLLLEQNNAQAAVEQLTSYTLLEPSVVDGWLKLGSAQIKTEELDLAEKSFKTALDLEADNPAALNGLGLIQVIRRRPLESLQYFKKALEVEKDFSPAALNLAIVTHDQLKNKPLALQMYKEFLEIKPRPSQWEDVASLAQALEQELNPAPVKTPPVTQAASASRNRSDTSRSVSPPTAGPASNPPVRLAPLTNRVSAVTNRRPDASTNLMAKVRENAEEPKGETNRAKLNVPSPNAEPAAPSTDLARLKPAPPPPPPIQVAPKIETSSPRTPAIESPSVELKKESASPQVVDSNKPKVEPNTTPAPTIVRLGASNALLSNRPESVAPANRPVESSTNFALNRPTRPLAKSFSLDSNRSGYHYIHPTAPLPGDRKAAEPHFKEGLKWHRAGRQAIAVQHYQEAIKRDPAFFEAYFNQGLAASEVASWKHALAAYEMAMAINPNSLQAHYHFCMALKKANYPDDAVSELKRLLAKHPRNAMSHLALANMYAQQLNQPDKAREHYLRVIELQPTHPEASKIRYWLSTNR